MKNTPNKWLVDLLLAFNSGDIAKFDEMKPKWAGVPDLAAQELKLRQKISLLCLMEVCDFYSCVLISKLFSEALQIIFILPFCTDDI